MEISSRTYFRDGALTLIPAILAVILLILVGVPLLTIIYVSLINSEPFSGETHVLWTLSNYTGLWSTRMFTATVNTLLITAIGCMISMTTGCGMAWLAARTDVPFKGFVHLAGIMPLLISLLVASVTWSLLGAGNSGYLNIILRDLGFSTRIEMQSLFGIAFVMGLYYSPYPFMFVYSALTLVHPELEEAAAMHGGRVPAILRKITFPLVKPAMLGSWLLVMVLMIEDFPVPQLLGAPVGIETLSIRIYNLMVQLPSSTNQAAALSVVLTLIVCVLIYLQRFVLGGKDYRTVTGKGHQFRVLPLGRLRWVAFGFVLLFAFVSVGLPLLALTLGALRRTQFIPNAAALFDFSSFTLEPLRRAIDDHAVRSGLINSLQAASATAILGSVFFFLLAYVINRTQLPGHRALEYIVMAPLAIPALVMGLGIFWTWVAAPVPIYGTLTILVIAFLTRFMPQGYRAVAASISQIHDELEHAAQVAGATRTRAMWRIVFPLVRSGVVSSAFIMFILSLRELTASLFLFTTDTRVLSIVIFESYRNGDWSAIASLSLIYTMLLIAVALIARPWMRVGL